jgi:quinol monooxygenase YgiN
MKNEENEKYRELMKATVELMKLKETCLDFGLTEREAKEMGFMIIKFPNEKTSS